MKQQLQAQFCAMCGATLHPVQLSVGEPIRLACSQCNYVHYDSPKVLVSTLITHESKLLMCQRAIQPGRGGWTIPGGFLELGETLEEGAARETFEETGVIIPPNELVLYNAASMVHLGEIYVTFRGIADRPEVTAGPESMQAKYWTEADVPWGQFAFSEMESYIRIFFNELKTSEFRVQSSYSVGSGKMFPYTND